MYLTKIEDIKEEGTTVFMPSGIQATVYNMGDNILVKYYDLREDKYSVEDFKKLMNEGIFIFNDRPTTQVIENKEEERNMDNSIYEKLLSKGFMKPMKEEKVLTLKDVIGKDATDFKSVEDIVDYINGQDFYSTPKEQAWATEGFDADSIEVVNIHTGEKATINLKNIGSRYGVNETDENGETTLKSFFNLDQDKFKSKDELVKHIQDNTDYDVVGSDNLSLTVKDRTDDKAESIVINLPHNMPEAYDQSKNKVGDIHKAVQYKKEHPEYLTPEFKLELMANLDRIAREYPNVAVRQQAVGYLDEVALQEYWDTKRIIDFVKKYIDVLTVKVLENEDPMRIEFENKVVTSLKENLEENLGKDYLSYLGKVKLICESDNNKYDIICAISEDADEILSVSKEDFDEEIVNETISMLNYKIRRDELDEVLVKHDITEVSDDLVAAAHQGYASRMSQSGYANPEKEAMKKFNRQVIARNERRYGKDYFNNFKVGDVVKNIEGEKGRIERKDGEGKYGILNLTPLEGVKRNIDGYAWEFVPVAQNESLNEMIIDCILDRKDGEPYSPETFYKDVFEYGDVGFDITRAMDGGTEQDVKNALKQYIDNQGYAPEIKDYIDSVEWLNESFIEELGKTYINIKGQDVNIESDSYNWIDDDTFVLHLPESGYLTDEAGDKFTVECEYHADENDYRFTAVFEDDRISLDRENTFISEDNKELIKEQIDKLVAEIDPIHESVEIKEDNKAPYEVIAQDLIDGFKDGFEPTEYGNWLCKTSLDFVWEKLTPNMKLFILQMIGHSVDTNILSDNDFRVKLNYPICDEYDLDDNDLESLGLFEREEILNMINDNYKTIDFLMDYEIQFDSKVGDKNESKKVKKSSKNSLKENTLKEEYGEYQGQLNKVADDLESGIVSGTTEIEGQEYSWNLTINGSDFRELNIKNSVIEEWIRQEISYPVRDGHDRYIGLDTIFTLGEFELENYYLDDEKTTESIIADLVKLGCDEETLKDAIDYIKKNGDKDRSDCKEVEWWIDYDINLVEVEDDEDDLDEQFKLKDKKKKKKEKIEDSMNESADYIDIVVPYDLATYISNGDRTPIDFDKETYEPMFDKADEYQRMGDIEILDDTEDTDTMTDDFGFQNHVVTIRIHKNEIYDGENKGKEEKRMNEDCYKVYNNIDNQDCGTFNSWKDAMNFLNKEWGTYSVNMAKENPHFGTEEDKLNYFGQFDLVPTQLPVAVEPIEEPIAEPVIEPVEVTPTECEGDCDIEEFIASLLDEPACCEPECTDGECVEPACEVTVCPDCGEEVCVCEKVNEMCMQKLPDPEEIKNKKGEEKAVEKKEKKQEAFKDGMTDINELDFPDAMHQAVDTKEDGSLYKISDIGNMISELKANFEKEIADFKNEMRNEIKMSLNDLKQDIKSDVKDIQTDVTSKLDNTNSKIADLTSEEEMEDEELNLENENPTNPDEELDLENEKPEGAEEEEAPTEPEMTEAELKEYKKVLMSNPLYEQIKEVIRGSSLSGKKMSVDTICTKLREEYGVRTDVELFNENICGICQHTPVSKYIIDKKLEDQLIKDQNLGIAKKYLKEGLNTVWERKSKLMKDSNLRAVINNEDLDQAKKAVDMVSDKTNGDPEAIRKAIDLTAENDQEKQQALDYAVDKIEENVDMDSLSLKLSRATSNGLLGGLGQVSSQVKNIPLRRK